MIFPDNAFDKLGFTEVKGLIRGYCLSEMGREMADRIRPMTNFDQIDKFLRQSNEFKTILESDSPVPIGDFFNLETLARKAAIDGAFLTEDELFRLMVSLQTVFAVIGYFNDREGLYPNLVALFEHTPREKKILQEVERVIDPKGKIRPNASRELADITAAIAKAESEARKRVDIIFKNARDSGWTADGSLTIRDGRMCIPLLAENKRKLRGYIHDESASGQTVYLEPEEVFQLNNRVRDLEFDKRREIVKILTALTTALRPYTPLIESYHRLLAKLDFVRAKSLFAVEMEGTMPELMREPVILLRNARHPLLLRSMKKQGHPVVPLNITVDATDRIILVSGPNAGGKSVCMKTVGLLQLMVQAGLLIPADSYSKVGIFRKIFADIGDDQSIESDLSTYSAHLSKMKYFTEHADAKTLVLIDEFGTGTDPQFGGPIAEAVLEVLHRKSIRGVITTHYSNLKLFASSTPGIENASMLFDPLGMKPLYLLQIGKPGSSYAFEIAQKIGLSAEVVALARNKIGEEQKRADSLLIDLEKEKRRLVESKVTLDKQQHRVKILLEENEKLKTYLEENKKGIIKDAKLEAQHIILSANKLVENTISEIRESGAEKEKTKKLREELKAELRKNETLPASAGRSPSKSGLPSKPMPVEAETGVLEKGDWVRLSGTETVGMVMDLSKDNVILAIGDLRSVVKLKRVEKIARKEVPKEIRRSLGAQLTEDIAQFKPEIDVRGMRGEDAVYEIEKLLDRALMMGFSNLKILHGKGDGILRKLIRDYLRKYSHVSHMEDEHADRGGDGITYVYLK